jgi:hypothetical protein
LERDQVSYVVAGREFPRKADVKAEADRIRTGTPPGERVTDDNDLAFIRALLSRHPDGKRMDYDGVTTQMNQGGTVSFRLLYPDGTGDDFSTGKCITALREEM